MRFEGVAAAAAALVCARLWASHARARASRGPAPRPAELQDASVVSSGPREGARVDTHVRFFGSDEGRDAVSSPAWTLGDTGWSFRFVALRGGGAGVSGRHGRDTFVKVLSGAAEKRAAHQAEGGGEVWGVVPDRPRAAVTRRLGPREALWPAGEGECVVALLESDPEARCARTVAHTESLELRGGVRGLPLAEWARCDSYGWGPFFDGQPFFNLAAFHVHSRGRRVATAQLWAAGLGVSCGDHDHSELAGTDAFLETHVCLMAGTGAGGMVHAGTGELLPLAPGQEHGAYWRTRPVTGEPVLRADGSVVYPPHRWQAGGRAVAGTGRPERFDVWAAFEIPAAAAAAAATTNAA